MAIRHPEFSFQPTDEHLFFHYSLRRLNKEPLPNPNVVHDCDVYGGGDPWNIFDKDKDEKFYVFSVLKKKNKSRVDRTAGSSTWKGKQSHEIKDSRDAVFNPPPAVTPIVDFAGDAKLYLHLTTMMTVPKDILCTYDSLAFSGDMDTHWLPATARNVLQEDTRHITFPAFCGDANDVSSLPTTTMAARQDTCGASSLAFGGPACLHPMTTMAVQNDTFYTTDSQAFRCNGNTNSLAPAAPNMQGDTCNEACWAFGGPSADSRPTTSMAARGIDSQWAHQLMNMEIDPFNDYLFHIVVKQPAQALNARNGLIESQPEGVPANWPVEFLDFGNCI
ncbi:hypothetical protein NL676_010215 [Syzygium grande]|nr:hypothetical protein NL676_010215 [Syzygium grande]